jgi:molybdopterin synthase sulfur carrier subunit
MSPNETFIMQEPHQTSNTKQIQVLFFGALAEITGTESIAIQTTENTDQLSEKLLLLYPGLKNQTYKIAVNQTMISQKQDLKEGDVIALLAPFAGG